MSTTNGSKAITAALDGMMGAGFGDALAGAFEKMDWAENEIARAQKRHRGQADLMWHCFKLLNPTHDLMGTEWLYRSHCRELLERMAAGQDTRPGTVAEICCACSDASQLAPLTETAAGLYGRVFSRAYPGHDNPWKDSAEHYEALRSPLIDDLEREARHKTAQADRRVTEIDCSGRHHGVEVNCTAVLPRTVTVKTTVGPVEIPALVAPKTGELALF